MKTYFLGDLHGNNYALEACLRFLDQVGAERIVCLGDLVGWLPFGNRTLERIRGLGVPIVAGNHDLLVAGVFADDPKQVDRMQASAYNTGLLANRSGALDYLASLPPRLDFDRFVVVHHSPFLLPAAGAAPAITSFGYLNEAALNDSLAAWRGFESRLIVSGHDHLPAVYELPDRAVSPQPGDVVVHRPQGAGDLTVPIRADARYWVKAGSVGGPYRDGIALANLVIFDESRETLILKRLAYPTGSLYAELVNHPFARHLPTLKRYAELLERSAGSGCTGA